MANGRNAGRGKRDSGRDAGPFLVLPHSVMDCPGFRKLSASAVALLLEVARQFHGDDNGRMLLSRAYLATRGWNSADVIQRAKKELLDGGFIFETVKGHRPNRASWYAMTWRRLDNIPGFDSGVTAAFEQGMYRRDVPMLDVTKLKGFDPTKHFPATPKNAALIPDAGTGAAPIAPECGTAKGRPVPESGAMRANLGGRPVPESGHPLEEPSAVADSVPVSRSSRGPKRRAAPTQNATAEVMP